MTVDGIDVSKWQATTPPLAGLAFLIARASIGTTRDGMYPTHIAAAKAAGLVTGAYHFNWDEDADPATPDATPEEQARFFVAAAGDVDFLFLDVEGARAFEPAESDRFINEVHRLGLRCGLYMSASVYQWNVGQDYDWIAKWSSTPPAGAWEFWQWQGSPLDRDRFNGDLAALKALAGGEDMDGRIIPEGRATVKAGDVFRDYALSQKLSAFGADTPGIQLYGRSATVAAVRIDLAGGDAEDIHTGYVPIARVAVAPADCTAAVVAATKPLEQRIAGMKSKTAAFAADIADD